MPRTRFVAIALLLVGGFALPPSASGQIISSEEIVAEHVYVITSDYYGLVTVNNLLVVDDDRVVLVDTLPAYLFGMPFDSFPPLTEAIHWLTSGRIVDTLISTHFHNDHVDLNASFKEFEGTSTIIAHWRAGQFLATQHCLYDLPPGSCQGPYPPAAQPTQPIRGEIKLRLQDERITLKTVEKAHSNADVFVYLEKANIIFMGDLYFGGTYPIIDRAAGATVNGMITALHQALARIDDDTIVVPSHGPLGTREDVLSFLEMMETTKKMVRRLMASGLTAEAIIMHPSFEGLDAVWGTHPPFVGPLFRTMVYNDLAGCAATCD